MPALHVFAAVGSTNDVARTLADAGAPHGTVVIADEQHAGRGRHGRSWLAAPGRSLLLSIVLHPDTAGIPPTAPIRVGLAVARALEETCAIRPALKWPNDVLLAGRKVAGILCEASTTGARFLLIAGIGVNVAQLEGEFPGDLAATATSLHGAGCRAGRATVAGALLAALRSSAASLTAPLHADELRAFQQRDALLGRALTVDGVPRGVGAGLTPHGALRVRTAEGESILHAGTVRTAERPSIAHERSE